MNQKSKSWTYHWVRVADRKLGTTTLTSEWEISRAEMLSILNEWNRIAMIGHDVPTYHYWLY